jgi:hypothetical protein
MEGASIRGGRGLWGCRPGLISFPAERRSWREGCLRTGALTARTSAKVRISSQRDSEAAGWDTRRSYISMNRAVGAEGHAGDGGDPFAEGHAPAGNGKRGGFEYNCSCVLSGKHSCMTTEPRSRCVPRSPGLRTRSRHSRASAKPMNLTLRRQSVVRGLRRDGVRAALATLGRARQTRTQPGGEVSDQFGFISEVGHSSGRRNGAPAECSVRKMAVLTAIADVLAGRSLAAYYGVLGDRRSLAPYCGVLPVRSIAGYCWFMSGGASRHPAGVSWVRPV